MTRIIPSDNESSFSPVQYGSLEDFAQDPAGGMRELHRRYGDVAALQDGTQRIHFAIGPAYVKQVLSDPAAFHSRFFAIRGSRNSAQRRLTSGLLSMNGDEHRVHRRMVMEPFQRRAVAAYHDIVLERVREMLAEWKVGRTIDLGSEMTRFMLRLTAGLLFGVDLPELAYRIGELTDRWVALNHALGPAAFHPMPEMYDDYDALLAVAEELERSLMELVRIRRGGRLGGDVLSLLLLSHEGGQGISDEQLVGHMALLFAAAHLTSAHTLTWTLFLLAQHPAAVEKLRDELSDCREAAETIDRQEKLHYLDMVLKESMRILPASAYSQRIATRPVELGPFSLPPGAIVIFSQLLTHHLPELYAEPERFCPERWLSIHPGPYEYLPFGAGPRMCLGSSLAMMQFKVVIPEILRRFQLSSVAGSRVDARVMSTMLFPESPVMMRIGRPENGVSPNSITGNIHDLVTLPEPSEAVFRAA